MPTPAALRSLRLLLVLVAVAFPGVLVGPLRAATECRILAWDGDVEDVRVRGSDGERVMTVPSNFLSEPWRTAETGAVTLFRQVPASAAHPEGRELLATTSLPAEVPRVLLLLVRDSRPEAPTPFRLLVLPDTDAASGPNHVRIYNFTSRPAAWTLLDRPPETVPPRGQATTLFAPGQQRGPLRLAVADPAGWRVVVNRTIALPDAHRVLLFVRDAVEDPEASSVMPVKVRQIYEPVNLPRT